MRFAFALLAALLLFPVAGHAATTRIELTSADQSLGWIKGYRDHPRPEAVPELVKQLAAVGAFHEPEAAGVYVGFMAGVIGANPDKAEKLVASMAQIPAADQWAVVRAVAMSRLPGWRHLLAKTADHMPARAVMIDAYLTGELAGFDRYRMEPEKGTVWQQAGRMIGIGREDKDQAYLEPSPALLDTFWGFYFATGWDEPVADIADLVRWSMEANDLSHLTLGSAAKYSLAANASRDQAILQAVKSVRAVADDDLGKMIDEAIFAAEVSDTGRLRDEAAAAVTTLREKGPAYLRKVRWWGHAGEGAIALGCIVAAVTGQVQLGVPCVVGGAVTSAVLKYFAREG